MSGCDQNSGVETEISRCRRLFAALFRVRDERRKLFERGYFLAGVGGDEAESAVDGVTVGVDEAGEKSFALEVDAFRVGGGGFCYFFLHFGKVADGDDLVAANCDGFGVGILGIGGEDFSVEENPVRRIFLRPQSGRRKAESYDEKKNRVKLRESAQDRPFRK
jgi:hypothetical protein